MMTFFSDEWQYIQSEYSVLIYINIVPPLIKKHLRSSSLYNIISIDTLGYAELFFLVIALNYFFIIACV